MNLERIDMVGQTFGQLTVLERLPLGRIRCLCACGVEITRDAQSVRDGDTKACRRAAEVGHAYKELPAPRRIDMVGIVYNNLTVLEMLPKGKIRCKCACGKETITNAQSVRNGSTKSCGCMREKNAGRPPKETAPIPVIISPNTHRLLTDLPPRDPTKPNPLTTGGTFILANPELAVAMRAWLNSHQCYTFETPNGKYGYDYKGVLYQPFKSRAHAMLSAMLALIDADPVPR